MSEATDRNIRATVQFKEQRTPSGKKAFEAWCAIYENDGNNIAICAPTLDKLEEAWSKFSTGALNKAMAQHVWIVKAE